MERPRHFEDYVVGETRKTFGRTITETDFVVHAGHTGDFFPHHIDAEHMKAAAHARAVTWTAEAHIGTPITQLIAKVSSMARTATRFDGRLMAPWLCQSAIKGPKWAWSSSQLCRRGDDRAKAYAATRRNGIAGNSGKIIPPGRNETEQKPEKARHHGQKFMGM